MSQTNSTRSLKEEVQNDEEASFAVDEDRQEKDKSTTKTKKRKKSRKLSAFDRERLSCAHTPKFHRVASSLFILIGMGGMAVSGYFTVINMLNQGILSEYGANLQRSDPDAMAKAFASSTNDERRAYLQALWYFQLFAFAFGLWVFAIVRSMGAVPQWTKVVAYATFIPFSVSCQWIVNTLDLYMYLDFFTLDGAIRRIICQLRYIFNYSTWTCAGLSVLCAVISILVQMKANCS